MPSTFRNTDPYLWPARNIITYRPDTVAAGSNDFPTLVLAIVRSSNYHIPPYIKCTLRGGPLHHHHRHINPPTHRISNHVIRLHLVYSILRWYAFSIRSDFFVNRASLLPQPFIECISWVCLCASVFFMSVVVINMLITWQYSVRIVSRWWTTSMTRYRLGVNFVRPRPGTRYRMFIYI